MDVPAHGPSLVPLADFFNHDAGSLSADDKRKCFPTPPEGADCIRALVRVDLDAKDMVRNDALGAARFLRSPLRVVA